MESSCCWSQHLGKHERTREATTKKRHEEGNPNRNKDSNQKNTDNQRAK